MTKSGFRGLVLGSVFLGAIAAAAGGFGNLHLIGTRFGAFAGSVAGSGQGKPAASNVKLSTSSGTIAFDTGSGFVKVISDIGGSNTVVPRAYGAVAPVFSIDGRKLLFTLARDQEPGQGEEIYAQNADGSDLVRVTRGGAPRDFSTATFSRVVYPIEYYDDNGVYHEIIIRNIGATGTPTIISLGGRAENPVLSPDGTKVAYRRDDTVRIVNANGTGDTELVASDAGRPRFLPEGSALVYRRYGSIYRIGLDGSNETEIISGQSVGYSLDNPVVSADGTRLAMECDADNPGGVGDGICTAEIGGGAFAAIGSSSNDRHPVFSPDGNEIAYVAETFTETGTIYEIRKVPFSGGTIETIHTNAQDDYIERISWGAPAPQPEIGLYTSSPVAGGRQGVATVVLRDPAEQGGRLIWLGSSDPGVVNPGASVTVPEGQRFAQFTFTTGAGTTFRSAEITAQWSPVRIASSTVSVSPSAPDIAASNLVAPPIVNILQNFSASWTVSNIGEAPAPSGRDDRVYISPDNELFNGNDTQIAQAYQTVPPLEPGQSVTNSTAVANIPESAIPVDGTYYLFVYAGFQLDERGGNFSNNAVSIPVQVNRNLPDLVAENVVVPPQIEPNVPFNVEWTIRNRGSFETINGFDHSVFYSFDGTPGNADDIQIATRNSAPLPIGGTVVSSQQFTIPTLPSRPDGDGFFYIVADAGNAVFEGAPGSVPETNNTTNASSRFEYNVPDLRVQAIMPTGEVESESGFAFSWTTSNAGRRVAGPFTERVVFSLDDQLDPGDVELGSFPFSGTLVPRQTADRTQTVTIPTSAVPASGSYYIFVVTDSGSEIDEGSFEDNNSLKRPIQVRRLLRPDLRVTNVTAPAGAFFDQEIQLQFTVTNAGDGPTNGQWNDRIFIDVAQQPGGRLVATIPNTSSLDPGESYIAAAAVRIPRGLNGSYHVIVLADGEYRITEDNETNNSAFRAITLNVPPLPDLRLSNVQAPDEGFGGQPVPVSWTVTNHGDSESRTPANIWRDGIYLSRDQVFDPGDRRIGERPRTGTLAAGASYTVSNFAVSIPPDVIGDYYVFVQADYANEVYEFNNENNNHDHDRIEPGSPLNILGTPPDLAVTGPLTAPASETAGRAINVRFPVRNQGAFDVVGGYFDSVYLSTDQNFDRQADQLLGSVPRNGLAAGVQYEASLDVVLPDCLAGTFYLFGVTDSNASIFEFDPDADAEANNISAPGAIDLHSFFPDLRVTQMSVPPIVVNGAMPISWTVRNTGTTTALSGWTDRVYLIRNGQATNLGNFDYVGDLYANAEYSRNTVVYLPLYLEGEVTIVVQTDVYGRVNECAFEDNNATSAATQANTDLPDLRIASISAPSSTVVGVPFNIEWNGTNAGTGMTSSRTWIDGLYISSDQTISPNDVRISGSLFSAQLAAGQGYTASTTATVPNMPLGNYYLIVAADDGSNVDEGTDEANNASVAVPISLVAPDSDLRVTSVSAPSILYSGQSAEFGWTVTNSGSSPTVGSVWTDYVLLSRDSIVDSSDRILGFATNMNPLGAGESYSRTATLNVPPGLAGEYRVLTVADRNNLLVEASETNNLATPFPVTVQLPPPVDFSIVSVTGPTFSSPGETASFSWTIQNSSLNPARGTWQDSLYLSTDSIWDSGDVLIGQAPRSEPVGPSGAYVGNLNVQLPAMPAGLYHVIVRTDSRNSIRESNELNNIGFSAGQTTVTIPGLSLGIPLATTLGQGQERYYVIGDVPEDETMLIRLDGQAGSRNELFTRTGAMVSRARYDFQGARPGEADQENVVPETNASQYFTLVRGDYVPASFNELLVEANERETKDATQPELVQNVVVSAELMPFGVRSVSPESAGNRGYASLEINGAKFREGATALLVGPGGNISPIGHAVGTSRIAAIFDLRGRAAGEYDVVVRNPDNSTAILEDGFEVEDGGGYYLRSSIVDPVPLRGGTRSRITYSVSNDGRNDARNVPVLIGIPAGYGYSIDGTNFREYPTSALPAGAEPAQTPLSIETNGVRTLMLYAPVVRAGQSVEIRIDLDLPVVFGEFPTTIQILPPMEDWEGALVDLGSPPNPIAGSFSGFGAQQQRPGLDCWLELLRQAFFIVLAKRLGSDCVRGAWKIVSSLADAGTSLVLGAVTNNLNGWSVVSTLAGRLLSAMGALYDCARNTIPPLAMAGLVIAIVQLANQLDDCLGGPLKNFVIFRQWRSFDPNEKLGPDGYGAERWIGEQKPIEYRINFENLATATAPAQLIRIVDQLPPTLDPRTVRLKEIGFKQYRVVVPENRAFFQTDLQLGEDLGNIRASISAGLNIASGTVNWTLLAIDPATNERPVSPLVGLLPPNNPNRDGEGYVIFTVQPRAESPSRTLIANSATIYFDENEPIVTNSTSNLLDSDAPQSSVAPLPAVSESPDISLDWSGTDPTDGSGLRSFDVLASENGGPFRQVVFDTTETGAVFSGRFGRSYSFVSVARDNAGNLEGLPAIPDATVRIRGGNFEADVAPRPDGDNNGQVDDADVAQIRRFAAGLDGEFSYNEFQRADTAPRVSSGDGTVTVRDVVQARRFAAGFDPVAESDGPNATVSGPAGVKAELGSGRQLRVVGVSRVANTLTVAVDIDSLGDEVGAGFTLEYDPSVLSNPANASVGEGAPGAALAINAAQPGRVGVVIDKLPNQPLASGTRRILTLEFTVLSTAPTTVIGFGSDPVAEEIAGSQAQLLAAAFIDSTIGLLVPTSASVSVSGRVTDLAGNPIRNASLTLTDETGAARTVQTGALGYFRFDDVAAGRIYIVSVRHPKRTFASPDRVVVVGESVTDVDFRALE